MVGPVSFMQANAPESFRVQYVLSCLLSTVRTSRGAGQALGPVRSLSVEVYLVVLPSSILGGLEATLITGFLLSFLISFSLAMLLTPLFLLLAASVSAVPYDGSRYTKATTAVDTSTLKGKWLYGYQGWFRKPANGVNNHWAASGTPGPGSGMSFLSPVLVIRCPICLIIALQWRSTFIPT
jgi:hypothetical protein